MPVARELIFSVGLVADMPMDTVRVNSCDSSSSVTASMPNF